MFLFVHDYTMKMISFVLNDSFFLFHRSKLKIAAKYILRGRQGITERHTAFTSIGASDA